MEGLANIGTKLTSAVASILPGNGNKKNNVVMVAENNKGDVAVMATNVGTGTPIMGGRRNRKNRKNTRRANRKNTRRANRKNTRKNTRRANRKNRKNSRK